MKKVFVMLGLVIAAMAMNGCVTENKALGLASSSSGLVVKAPGSLMSGSTSAVDIWFADNCSTYASAPSIQEGEKTQIVFTMTKRRSFFGALFGIDATSEAFTYIGNPGETADETVKRVNAFTSVFSVPAASTGTDSPVNN